MCTGLSVPGDEPILQARPCPKSLQRFGATLRMEREQIFSLRCHTEQAAGRNRLQTCFMRMTGFHPLYTGYGGAGRDRTDDPLLAKQVLSQLSYGP